MAHQGISSILTKFVQRERDVRIAETLSGNEPAQVAAAILRAGQPLPASVLDGETCAHVKDVPLFYLFAKGSRVLVDVTPKRLKDCFRAFGITFDQLMAWSQKGDLVLNIQELPDGGEDHESRLLAWSERADELERIFAEGCHVYSNDIRKYAIFDALAGRENALEAARREGRLEGGLFSVVDAVGRYIKESEEGEAGPVARLAKYRGRYEPRKIRENIAYLLAYAKAVPGTLSEDPVLERGVADPDWLQADINVAAAFVSRVYTFHATRTAPLTGGYGGRYPRDDKSFSREMLNAAHDPVKIDPKDIAREAFKSDVDTALLQALFHIYADEVAPNIERIRLPQEALAIHTYLSLEKPLDDARLRDVISYMKKLGHVDDITSAVTKAQIAFSRYAPDERNSVAFLVAIEQAMAGRKNLDKMAAARTAAFSLLDGFAIGPTLDMIKSGMAPYAGVLASQLTACAANLGIAAGEDALSARFGSFLRQYAKPHREFIDLVCMLTNRAA